MPVGAGAPGDGVAYPEGMRGGWADSSSSSPSEGWAVEPVPRELAEYQ